MEPEPVGRDVAALAPELGIGVVAARPAGGRRAEIVRGEREPDTGLEAPLQRPLVAGEVSVAPGDADPGARREPLVTPREQVDPEQPGPPLHLHSLEEAGREERRIDRHAVHPRRHVRYAVQVVLGRARAASLEVDRLRTADVAAAPEIDAGDLAQQIAHGGAVHPFDGVAGEHEAGERRTRARRGQLRQNRHAHLALLLGTEVARGVVHGILGERVGRQRILVNLRGQPERDGEEGQDGREAGGEPQRAPCP